jgi:hypothetical protein
MEVLARSFRALVGLALCLSFAQPAELAAQSLPAAGEGWSIGMSVGYAPWRLNSAFRTVTLTGAADLSPVPSEVVYSDENRSNMLVLGLMARRTDDVTVGDAEIVPMLFGETSWLIQSGDFVNSATVGAGGSIEYGVSRAVRLGVTGTVQGSYLWGYLGRVGSAANDVYLEAPDGQQYQDGAEITISGLTYAVDLLASAEFGSVDGVQIRLEGGYRQSGDPEWKFKVSEGSRSSELPAAGFSANPPELRLSGPMLRVSVLRRF